MVQKESILANEYFIQHSLALYFNENFLFIFELRLNVYSFNYSLFYGEFYSFQPIYL